MILQLKVEIPESIAGDMSPEQKPAGGDGLAGDGKVAEKQMHNDSIE